MASCIGGDIQSRGIYSPAIILPLNGISREVGTISKETQGDVQSKRIQRAKEHNESGREADDRLDSVR